MLSDEVEILIKKLRYCEQEYEQNGYLSVGKFKAIKEAVNLIEKQSKEIEELKEENEKYKNPPFFDEDKYIENDKIKAKIEPVLKQLERKMQEEYNKYGNSGEYQDIVDAYNFLQSLLEKE